MKINNKRELQNIAINHSADIDYKDFIKMYRECTKEPYNFLTINRPAIFGRFVITSTNLWRRSRSFGLCNFLFLVEFLFIGGSRRTAAGRAEAKMALQLRTPESDSYGLQIPPCPTMYRHSQTCGDVLPVKWYGFASPSFPSVQGWLYGGGWCP